MLVFRVFNIVSQQGEDGYKEVRKSVDFKRWWLVTLVDLGRTPPSFICEKYRV